MNNNAPPKLNTPPGACDSAIHVYVAGTKLAPTATSTPPDWADLAAYRRVQKRLGLSRVIIVQPTVYGLDNSVTLDAVDALGLESARAVVVVDKDTPVADLRAMAARGACGARFQMLPGGAVGWDSLEPVSRRAADLGWHVQLQMDGRLLPERAETLLALPCPLVIDHVGKFLEPVTTDHPGFRALARLLGTGRCWLKLSGAYEVSRAGPPDFADVGALARAAVALAPERMVWGSNWPHVSKLDDPPDDAGQLDTLLHWVDDEALRRRILVDNAAALYRFA
ncbi:MAG: amidohydrolase family protein [Alphaproteobacteria bacterium]|nr:amidohydrolase family protein [Alphaproteobacteria bacterium]